MMVLAEKTIEGSNKISPRPLKTQHMADYTLNIIYESKNGGSLFSKENLIEIEQLENEITQWEIWNRICLAQSALDSSCSDMSFLSPINFLKKAFRVSSVKSLQQFQIDTWLKQIMNTPS